MFGTLINDQKRKESLTFVENTDPASALSLNRRDKPHTSCEFCRSRKVRCSGQPSGCDRCVAVSAECRYPGREARRRKRPASRRTDETWGQGQGQPPAGDGRGQAGRIEPQTADASVGMFDMEPGAGSGQQQIERWLSLYSVGDGSSSGSGLDEWLDIDSFLGPMLTGSLENPNDGMEMVDDAIASSLSADADSRNGFDDIEPGTSTSNFPSPDSLAQQLMASPYDVGSPLAFPITSTRSQPPTSGSNNNNTHRDASPYTPSMGRWPDQSPTTPNNVRSTSGSPDRGPTPAAHMMASPPSTTAASSPGSTSRGHFKDGCRCLHLTVRLLEELSAESASSDPAAMDVLLGYFRGALMLCATIFDCEGCTSLSEINMLLAMAGKYMSTICERIVMCYIGLQQAQEQRKNQHHRSISSPGAWVTGGGKADRDNLNGRTDTGTGPTGADDMWFSTYHIESNSERMQVLQCLVTVQLTEFSRLLERLKTRAGCRKGHLTLLTEAEKRIKDMQSKLRASADCPPASRTLDL